MPWGSPSHSSSHRNADSYRCPAPRRCLSKHPHHLSGGKHRPPLRAEEPRQAQTLAVLAIDLADLARTGPQLEDEKHRLPNGNLSVLRFRSESIGPKGRNENLRFRLQRVPRVPDGGTPRLGRRAPAEGVFREFPSDLGNRRGKRAQSIRMPTVRQRNQHQRGAMTCMVVPSGRGSEHER
jgi:hypothetical protein